MALEEAADPIVVYDVEGGAAFVNSAFARVFGWSAEELLGRKIPFVPEESMKETKALIRRILDGERCLDFETKRQ
ncbi:MAG: PAS domain S-box protein, partial [Nitrospinaceae bacterium]|nr:PAS domain S-box protein [Nitrospinaceae bacterium]